MWMVRGRTLQHRPEDAGQAVDGFACNFKRAIGATGADWRLCHKRDDFGSTRGVTCESLRGTMLFLNFLFSLTLVQRSTSWWKIAWSSISASSPAGSFPHESNQCVLSSVSPTLGDGKEI
eukprot:CAMPEP_0179353998 /NCGR_PEP_ID=MMETSP0797-20121207/76618_1 /TAXON_ID=47934 /ORGANISM="Dinophysis acuminata, Strain DAEP01" /LENGTH=119 /DNA_ID=CAMNT_0021069075 /DNA_START=32 /DNA_END=391 /DNA_ORIENTATION=+